MESVLKKEKFQIILWPLVTLLIFIATLVFNYTAAFGLNSDLGVGDVSDRYSLQITPSGWVFTIWIFIYVWQFLWIAYVLFLTVKHEMVKVIFGKYFFFAYNIGNVFNCLWIIVWVNELIVWASLFLIAMTTALTCSAFIAHSYMHRVAWTNVDANYGSLGSLDHDENIGSQGITVTTDMTEGLPIRQWLNKSISIRLLLYALVLNGIPFYSSWSVVASTINIGIVLRYELGMSDTAASYLVLSILTCCVLGYWYLDFYRLRFYLQYTFSPYFVLIVAFAGMLSSNGGLDVEERPSSVFALILLVLAVSGMIGKECLGMGLRYQKAAALQNV